MLRKSMSWVFLLVASAIPPNEKKQCLEKAPQGLGITWDLGAINQIMNTDALRGDVPPKPRAPVRAACFVIEAPCLVKCRTGHDSYTYQ